MPLLPGCGAPPACGVCAVAFSFKFSLAGWSELAENDSSTALLEPFPRQRLFVTSHSPQCFTASSPSLTVRPDAMPGSCACLSHNLWVVVVGACWLPRPCVRGEPAQVSAKVLARWEGSRARLDCSNTAARADRMRPNVALQRLHWSGGGDAWMMDEGTALRLGGGHRVVIV